MANDLHDRIAAKLGWTTEQCQSFSLLALAEIVRVVDKGLSAEIHEVVQGGSYIYTKHKRKRARR